MYIKYINQIEKQKKALKLLRDYIQSKEPSDKEQISYYSISKIILPLLKHFIIEASNLSIINYIIIAHELKDASFITLPIITKLLPWKLYYQLFKFFTKQISLNKNNEKSLMHGLSCFFDGFHFPIIEKDKNNDNDNDMEIEDKEDEELENEKDDSNININETKEDILSIIIKSIIPVLKKYKFK